MSAQPKLVRRRIGQLNHLLHVWDNQSETTVLLLHGFLDMGRGFSFLIDSLSDSGWNFITLDWRGHGGSDWIGPGGYYHFVDYVRDLEDCVVQLASKRLFIVGHSMGAMVLSLWLGATRRKVDGAVLLEGLGPVKPSEDFGVKRLGQWLDDMGNPPQPRYEADLAPMVAKLEKLYRRVPRERIERIVDWATVRDSQGVRWSYDPLHRTRSPIPIPEPLALNIWRRIEVPLLWIGGDESPWRGQRLEWWLSQRPNLRRQLLPNAGHMLQYEKPVETGLCIRSFVNSILN